MRAAGRRACSPPGALGGRIRASIPARSTGARWAPHKAGPGQGACLGDGRAVRAQAALVRQGGLRGGQRALPCAQRRIGRRRRARAILGRRRQRAALRLAALDLRGLQLRQGAASLLSGLCRCCSGSSICRHRACAGQGGCNPGGSGNALHLTARRGSSACPTPDWPWDFPWYGLLPY
jgi:hypothetical protein